MKKILIIDDDLDDIEILTEALKALGNLSQVHFVTTYQEVAPIAERFDYVFLDAHLPKVTCVECLNSIRSHQTLSTSTIIIYTGHIHQQAIDVLLKAGAHNILMKSGSLQQLTAKLRQLLQ
jgi:CheY-like chemotaxis protein